jgi:hypothetical protein
MSPKAKYDADNMPHSRPGSVDQQMEDTFPASDAPSFPRVIIGAPAGESRAQAPPRPANTKAAKKVRSGAARKPKSY